MWNLFNYNTYCVVTRYKSWFIQAWSKAMNWTPFKTGSSLQWRHNRRDGVSNHQPHDCLPNRLFTHRRKHQSSASLAFVRGIHRWPVNSPHKGTVTRKIFPFDDVIIYTGTVWWWGSPYRESFNVMRCIRSSRSLIVPSVIFRAQNYMHHLFIIISVERGICPNDVCDGTITTNKCIPSHSAPCCAVVSCCKCTS